MQKTKIEKIRIALAVILMTLTVFSTCIASLEAGHECSGEDCPICHVISVAESNLKLLELFGFAVTALSVFFVPCFTKYFKSVLSNNLGTETLITQKIRLND